MTTIILTPDLIMADTKISDGARPFGDMNKLAMSKDRWWASGSGDCAAVQAFLSWFSGIHIGRAHAAWVNKSLPEEWPGSTTILLLSPDRRMFFFEGYRPVEFNAPYATEGSGGQFALGALEGGNGPLSAMRIAAKLDPHTGGAVDCAHAGSDKKVRYEIHKQVWPPAPIRTGSVAGPVQQGESRLLCDGTDRQSTASGSPQGT